jgi:hypothetical protein
MEATTTTFTAEQWARHEQFVETLRAVKQRKQAWKEDVRRREAELQVELQRAKDDPFYRRGMEGMACEPAPMAEPVFKRGSFAAAIRKHRAFQSQWQESINQKLDEREETRRKAMEKFQLELEEV